MNKNIIIAILIVIIIAVVGAFVLTQPAQTQNGKLNTQMALSRILLMDSFVFYF